MTADILRNDAAIANVFGLRLGREGSPERGRVMTCRRDGCGRFRLPCT